MFIMNQKRVLVAQQNAEVKEMDAVRVSGRRATTTHANSRDKTRAGPQKPRTLGSG